MKAETFPQKIAVVLDVVGRIGIHPSKLADWITESGNITCTKIRKKAWLIKLKM